MGEFGVQSNRIGDTFYVSLSNNVTYETLAASAVIAPTTQIVVFDGAPGSVLELPPAVAGRKVEIWNFDTIDNVNVAAAAGETVNALADVDVYATYVGRFISIIDGEWLAHVS